VAVAAAAAREESLFHVLFKGVDVPPNTVRASYLPTPVPGIVRLQPHEIDAALAANDGAHIIIIFFNLFILLIFNDFSRSGASPSIEVWRAEMSARKSARRAYQKQKAAEEKQCQVTNETEEDSDVMVVDPADAVLSNQPKRKMKFFKFHENNRPAYFGTLWPPCSLLFPGLTSKAHAQVRGRSRATACRPGIRSSRTPFCLTTTTTLMPIGRRKEKVLSSLS
jgi:hypothetical protein